MKVTSVKIRYIQNSHIFCIASVTLDNQLIINDIKIYRDNEEYVIRLPNSRHAERNNQYSIVPNKELQTFVMNELKLIEKEKSNLENK